MWRGYTGQPIQSTLALITFCLPLGIPPLYKATPQNPSRLGLFLVLKQGMEMVQTHLLVLVEAGGVDVEELHSLWGMTYITMVTHLML